MHDKKKLSLLSKRVLKTFVYKLFPTTHKNMGSKLGHTKVSDMSGDRKQKLAITLLAGLALNLSGQAWAGSSGPAPITYKLASPTGAVSQFSSAPRISAQTSPHATSPLYTAPRAQPVRPVAPPRAQAQLATPAQTFNFSKVDTKLYSHQRVGKTYSIKGKSYTPKHDPSYDEAGIASWYGPSFNGKLTANGETYDMDGLTAAHKTLPLNSKVFVTNLENGKTVMLRINDRGPFIEGRIIDLSRGAAKVLGVKGLGKVRVQYAGPADPMDSQMVEIAPVKPRVATPKTMPKVEPKAPVVAEITPPAYKPLSVVPQGQPVKLSPQQVSKSEPQTTVPQMFDFSAPAAPVSGDAGPLRPAETRDENRPAQTFKAPEGGVMTLTITGPIHMASADTASMGKVIPALYTGAKYQGSEMPASAHYIQAAAFSSMARAESVRSTLSPVGAFSVSKIERNGKSLYRVLVGPYTSERKANAAKSLVATLGYTDARIIDMH